MVSELVVLHESAVDNRNAEIDVEQNRHRLELADNHVAKNPDEWKNSLRVRHSSRKLAAQPLPFLEQILEDTLHQHSRNAYRVQHDEHRHPLAAEPLVDGHFLAGRNRECDSLRVTVHQVHITRAARERSRRSNPVANVLHAFREIARDDFMRRLVVKTECWNTGIFPVKDSRLAVRSR